MNNLPKFPIWYPDGWDVGEPKELQDNNIVDGVLFVPKEQQFEDGRFIAYTVYRRGGVYGWYPSYMKKDMKNNYLSTLRSIASVISLPQRSKMKKNQLVDELRLRIQFL